MRRQALGLGGAAPDPSESSVGVRGATGRDAQRHCRLGQPNYLDCY